MREIIDIDEELVKSAKIAVQCDIADDCVKSVANGIIIPDNATNGDVITAMFPNLRFYSDGGWIYFEFNGRATSFCSEAFWNSPYRKEHV